VDADYTASASSVVAFSAVVCWTDHLFIVIMANAKRNADLSRFRSAITKVHYHKGPGWTGLDTNNLFLLNCRRERQTNPNPGPLR